MSIEDKIREIAEREFKGYSYVFEDWNGAAKVVDRVSLPAIICVLPSSGYFDIARGKVKDSEDMSIAFVDKVVRDANGDDNEEVYTRMKRTAGKFIDAMNKSRYFEPIEGKIRYQTILESASAYLTGVFVELNVKESTGVCLQ
ncbi:hypothetical protein [Segatella oris]|uniref:hypothetical protein n=1 Tax=Segatella oris TaxID=28135 RepID=UPI0028E21C3D|nr:hypothetical protein [Segatella oris]